MKATYLDRGFLYEFDDGFAAVDAKEKPICDDVYEKDCHTKILQFYRRKFAPTKVQVNFQRATGGYKFMVYKLGNNSLRSRV